MKIEREPAQFEPITITLVSELEVEFVDGIFNASNADLKRVTNMCSSDIECVLNRTDGYAHTSRQMLNSLWSRPQ